MDEVSTKRAEALQRISADWEELVKTTIDRNSGLEATLKDTREKLESVIEQLAAVEAEHEALLVLIGDDEDDADVPVGDLL